MRKEIYASLAIADHEIRILVSEFHNGRLNILKVERVEHNGVQDNRIVNENEIIMAIDKGLKHIQSSLQFQILRVLLLVESKDTQRVSRIIKSDINDPLNRVQVSNVKHIYQQAHNLPPLEGLELINAEVYRYKLNGVYLRKSPVNEKTHRLNAEVDLYYVNREIVYQLANIVEKAGLEILDVCLNSYAIGKEAGLFNKAPEEYVVGVNIERQSMTFSLFYRGRLVHTEIVDLGYGIFIDEISKSLTIPQSVTARLMMGNVDFSTDQHSEYPVYLWSQDRQSFTCSQRDLMDIIKNASERLFETIKQACQPIIETGPTSIVVVGEGSMLKGIDKKLGELLQVKVDTYLPTTLGARDGAFVASLGAFYATVDHQQYQSYQDVSISIVEYEEVITNKTTDDSQATFSTRLKSFLKDPIKGGTNND
ncbi:MAG: hypothetical protein GX775_02330 [Erysipelothrix sp.]|nr:hypothetical protein [Erysipelothrix sp.]